MTTSTPPGTPSFGDAYVIAATASGVWAGRETQIARYYSGWKYQVPAEGWLIYDQATGASHVFDGAAWIVELVITGLGVVAPKLVAGDNTALIQNAIDAVAAAGGGVVWLPAGTWNVTQISVPATVSIKGPGLTACILLGTGAVDTIVSSAKWVDQHFTGFTVSHAGNANTGANIKLIHAKHGANRCVMDLIGIGTPGVSNGGVWIRGVNPDTGVANQNEYYNSIKLRMKSASTVITGEALWLYGESVSLGKANSNVVEEASNFSGWSIYIRALGSQNKFNKVYMAVNAVAGGAGYLIEMAAINESMHNMWSNCSWDGSWTADKVRVVSEIDAYQFVGTFVGCALLPADIIRSGTYGAKVNYSLYGYNTVLGGFGNYQSLDLSVDGHGIGVVNDDGLIIVNGGNNVLSGKLAAFGKDLGTIQAGTPGGASALLNANVASAWRVASTVDGVSFTQRWNVDASGTMHFGVLGTAPTMSVNAGSPIGVVAAPVGSLVVDSTNGRLWLKLTGVSTAAWIALGEDYQEIATDVAFSIGVDTPRHTRHTGTLTADRAVTLLVTNAKSGLTRRITRSGGGAFNLNVGTGPLNALATNQWCDVTYNGTAWYLAAYGTL